MIIARNDEAKRSQIWRIVTTTASVLIVVVAVFFLVTLFTSNPVEGTWISEDSDLSLTVKNNNTIVVNVPEVQEDTDVKVEVQYSIDKDAKTITIKKDQAELEKIAEASDGRYTAETVETALSSVLTTFGYSVDGDELTLTEREYGEQMLFTRE